MVSFQDAIKLGFKRWLDFSGRSSRSEYWLWSLFVMIVILITMTIDNMIFHTAFAEAGLISNITSLVLLIPGLSNAFRRLHDIDKSAWWLLIGLIPFVGAIILLVWFCKKGTFGSNRFGEDRVLNEPVIS